VIGFLSSEIPDANLSRPSFKDTWHRLKLSGKVPISEFIGFSGFGISRILETRGPGHIISRNREERSRPSVCWATWQQSTISGKVPKRSTPSENRRSRNRGGKEPRHQKSRNPDSRYPDTIWTVRSMHDLDR
jgi:hypothetical protein